MEKRFCYVADYRSFDENGFIPCAVIEGEPGMSPMLGNGPHAQPWYWGKTEAECQAHCDKANAERGLSKEDVARIVLSSMKASTEAGV